MSYDIFLTDPVTGDTLELPEPHFMRGGTYALGGTNEARLNVTYNYARYLRLVFEELPAPRPKAPAWLHELGGPVEGIRTIYGLTGAESQEELARAILLLKNDVTDDYWEATEGNVKRALMQLRALATMCPDGIWSGD